MLKRMVKLPWILQRRQMEMDICSSLMLMESYHSTFM